MVQSIAVIAEWFEWPLPALGRGRRLAWRIVRLTFQLEQRHAGKSEFKGANVN
jgi:hypothetical protein